MAVFQRVVFTAGTSAINPTNLGKPLHDRGILVRKGFTSVIAEGVAPEALEEAVRALDYGRWEADPDKVSAEFSALFSLFRQHKLAERPTISLIATKTPEGALSARVVAGAMEAAFDAKVKTTLVDLDISRVDEVAAKVGLFMAKVAEALEEGEPSSTAFFPLGGYKFMTTTGYLAGAFLGYPTLYLHEDKQDVLHTVPAIPLAISEETLRAHADWLWRAGNGVARAELSAHDLGLVAAAPWLYEVADDLVGASGFANFLKARHPHILGTQIHLHREAAKHAQELNLTDFALQQLGNLVNHLERASGHADLKHEWWALPAGWHFYKGASNGQNVFRALYRVRARTLEIRQMWFQHKGDDNYERPQPEDVSKQLRDDERCEVDWTGDFYGR